MVFIDMVFMDPPGITVGGNVQTVLVEYVRGDIHPLLLSLDFITILFSLHGPTLGRGSLYELYYIALIVFLQEQGGSFWLGNLTHFGWRSPYTNSCQISTEAQAWVLKFVEFVASFCCHEFHRGAEPLPKKLTTENTEHTENPKLFSPCTPCPPW
jgi:hypothetical protein